MIKIIAIIIIITVSMKKWKTNLYLNHAQGSENINIKCGIFQGDSLSPLLSAWHWYPSPMN